jgi:FSR family fosmidomycin resistance protein-like MFS transporter
LAQEAAQEAIFPAQAGGRPVLALSLGHALVDFYPGYLASLLPYLIAKLGLSLTVAGAMASLESMATSLVQPLLGYFADSGKPRPWTAIGLAVAAMALSLMVFAPSAWALAALITVGGLGVALYHPQGAALAAALLPSQASTALAFFSTGGSIGHALGPLVAVIFAERWGLESVCLLALPGLCTAWFVYRALKQPLGSAAACRAPALSLRASFVGCGGWLLLLLLIMTLRAAVSMSVSTMLPLYLMARGGSAAGGGAAIFLFRAAAAIGVFVGGPLADRAGHRAVFLGSFLLPLPCFALFFGGHPAGMLALGVGAAVMATSTSVNTVLAQQAMPRNQAMASGLMIGVGWALGSLSVTAIGFMADRLGILLALPIATFALTAAGFFACLPLLSRHKQNRGA